MSFSDSEDFTRLMKAYLPEKHWDIMKGPWNGWKEMYGGTKQEFINDVIKFASFPGSSGYFGLELAAPYITKPNKYVSYDGKVFVYKQDLFIIVQNVIDFIDFPCLKSNHFIKSIIGFYLKTMESKLEKGFEFVQFPEESLKMYCTKLDLKLKTVTVTVTLEKTTSIGEVVEMITKMLPTHGKDPNYTSIQKLVEKMHREKPIGKNVQFYEELLSWVGFLIDELRKFVDSNPTFFMPREPGQNDEISFVRIFDDGMHRGKRGLTTMKLIFSGDAKELEKGENRFSNYYTDPFEKNFPIFERYVDKLKAIKIDIVHRHKHRATFIPFFDGEYCIRAADLFLELWGEVINVHGYLQRLNEIHWMLFKPLIIRLGDLINQPTSGEKLIDVRDALRIKREFLRDMETILDQYPTQIKEVRQLDGKGFTVEKMKNEMSRLGLMISFDPNEVMQRLALYFNHFDGLKKGKVFKTCDLYDTLGRLQLALLASRFTGISAFLHLYRSCNFLLEPCMWCKGSLKLTSVPRYTNLEERDGDKESTPSEGESEEEEVEKRKEKRKRRAEKKKLESKARRTSADVENFGQSSGASSTSDPSLPSLEAPPAVPQPLGVPKENHAPDVAPADVQKPEPEVGSCMKCYRTSQYCEETKTKLREERIKNKALTKQVREGSQRETEKDQMLEEKDEEIRLLKERIAALESSNQKDGDTDDDEDPPLRFLAPTNKKSEFSEEVRNKFNELLNLKDTQYTMLFEEQMKSSRRLMTTETSRWQGSS